MSHRHQKPIGKKLFFSALFFYFSFFSSAFATTTIDNNDGSYNSGYATSSSDLTIFNNNAGQLVYGAISNSGGDLTINNGLSSSITDNTVSAAGTLNINNSGTFADAIRNSSGGAIIISNSGSFDSNINLGSNANSAVTLSGGSLTGSITMNNANQIVDFAGGSTTKGVNGAGKVVISSSTTLIGNIGNIGKVTSISVNNGQTLDAAAHNSILNVTNINLASGSTLSVGSGAITATINGVGAGSGSLNFNSNYSLSSNTKIGTNTAIGAINIASGVTLDTLHTNLNTISADDVNLGTGSTFILRSLPLTSKKITLDSGSTLSIAGGSGSAKTYITGAIDGRTDGDGTLIYDRILGYDSFAAGTTIGANHALGTIIVNSNKFLDAVSNHNSINANNIILNSGSSLAIGNGSLTSSNITLDSGSGLYIAGGGAVNAQINGLSNGLGSLAFLTNSTLGAGTSIGNNHALSQVSIDSNFTLDAATNNISISANQIVLNSGSTLLLGNGIINATINGNGNGTLKFNSNYNFSSGLNISSIDTMNIASGVTVDTATNHNAINADSVNLNSGSSFILRNANLNADNILLDSGSILSIAGSGIINSKVNGLQSGSGSLNFNSNYNLSSGITIGTITALGAINIASGVTVDTVTNYNSIYADNVNLASGSNFIVRGINLDANNITLNSGSTLTSYSSRLTSDHITLNQGSTLLITGSTSTAANTAAYITGAIDGDGTLVFDRALAVNRPSFDSGATIGANHALGTIIVNSNKFLDAATNNNSINANNIILNSGSSLTIGSGALTSSNITLDSGSTLLFKKSNNGTINAQINGLSNGLGTIQFDMDNILGVGTIIGANHAVGTIIVSDGKILDAATNNNAISSSQINLGSNSRLLIGSGILNAAIDGPGSITFNANQTINKNIGSSAGLINININDFANVVFNNDVNADSIIIGQGLGGSLTQNSGILGSNASQISINRNATLVYGGGEIKGKISGLCSGCGTFDIAADYTNSSIVGEYNYIENLNIRNGKTFTVNKDINASNITLAGILDLANSPYGINGDVVGTGTGTINSGSSAHNINGKLTMTSGDTLGMTVDGQTNSHGSITSNDVITINSGVKLTLNLLNPSSLSDGLTQYNITSGASGSNINQITSSNIFVNGGQNTLNFSTGSVTASTQVVGNNLVLDLTKITNSGSTPTPPAPPTPPTPPAPPTPPTPPAPPTPPTPPTSPAPSSPSGGENIAADLQTMNSLQKSIFNTINNSVTTAENRLEAMRNSSEEIVAVTSNYKTKSGVSSGDNHHPLESAWAQTFATSAKQGNFGGLNGYLSNSVGAAFGGDKLVTEQTRIGVAASYANTAISSSDNSKKTYVNTYQINGYSGQTFGQYFLDTILGIALNKYNSSRTVQDNNSKASAKYNGHSYAAKIKGGYVYNFGNGFNLTPDLNINFVHNVINNYTESGADDFNMNVKTSSSNFLEGRLGLNLGYQALISRTTRIAPVIRVSYGYDFIGNKQTTVSNFVDQSASYSSSISKVNRESLKLGTGIEIYRAHTTSFKLDYTFEHKSSFKSHTGLIKVKHEF